MSQVMVIDSSNALDQRVLASALTLSAREDLIELNAVLPKMRRILGRALEQAPGTSSGVSLVLEGFRREGKGAQAYFLARDWLRMGELRGEAPTRVVIVGDASDLRQAKGACNERTLVVVKNADALFDADEPDDTLASFWQARGATSLLALARQPVFCQRSGSRQERWGRIIATAVQQGRAAPILLELAGVPRTLALHHIQRYARHANVTIARRECDALIDAATIATSMADRAAPRLLVGVIHGALEDAANSATGSVVQALQGQLCEYFLREIQSTPQELSTRIANTLRTLESIRVAEQRASRSWPTVVVNAALQPDRRESAAVDACALKNVLHVTDRQVTLVTDGALALYAREPACLPRETIVDIARATITASSGAASDVGAFLARCADVEGALEACSACDVDAAWDTARAVAAMSANKGTAMPAVVRAALMERDLGVAARAGVAEDVDAWAVLLSVPLTEDHEIRCRNAVREHVSARTWHDVLLVLSGAIAREDAILRWMRWHPLLGGAEHKPADQRLYGVHSLNEVSCDIGAEVLVDALASLCQRSQYNTARQFSKCAAENLADELLLHLVNTRWPLSRRVGSLLGDMLQRHGRPVVGMAVLAWRNAHRPHAVDALAQSLVQWWASLNEPCSGEALRVLKALRLVAEQDVSRGALREAVEEMRRHSKAMEPGAYSVADVLQNAVRAPLAVAVAAECARADHESTDAICLLAEALAVYAAIRADSQAGDETPAMCLPADGLLARLGTPYSVEESLTRHRELMMRHNEQCLAPITVSNDHWSAVTNIGDALQAGELVGAHRMLTRFLEGSDEHLVGLLLAADMYDQASKRRRTREVLVRAYRTHPDSVHVLARLGNLVAEEGDHAAAYALFRRICELLAPRGVDYLQFGTRAVTEALNAREGGETLGLAADLWRLSDGEPSALVLLGQVLYGSRETRMNAQHMLTWLSDGIPPEESILRLQFSQIYASAAEIESNLAKALRDVTDATDVELIRVAQCLHVSVDQQVIHLVAALSAGRTAEASAVLEELAKVVPAMELSYFTALVHAKRADEYEALGIIGQAMRHIEIAYAAYVRAVWRGFSGAGCARLGAEILCLRLICAKRRIEPAERARAQEQLTALATERPEVFRAQFLSTRLSLACFEGDVMSDASISIPSRVEYYGEDLLRGPTMLATLWPDEDVGFVMQFRITDVVVKVIAYAEREEHERRELEELLQSLQAEYFACAPMTGSQQLARAETALRLAEGYAHVSAAQQTVSCLLEEVSGRLGAVSSVEVQGSMQATEHMRLVQVQRRASALGLKYAAR